MNVKLARVKMGMNQIDVCKAVKMSPRKLCEIERGEYDKVTYKNMVELSRLLNVTVQELFFS